MGDRKIVIPYAPRAWAQKFHNTDKRWIVLVCHRRAGKTVSALNHLQRDAIRTPNARFAYIAPTYKQAKNIAWDLLKFYARPIPGVEFNEVELTVRYPNGSRLTLYGADNPDSLRGIGLWGVVFDEYSQQPSNIFTEIIRPALADHSGYAIWIGTPKGKNDFYRLYAGIDAEGKSLPNQESWFKLILRASESGIIRPEEIEDARATMTADEFEQEFECSFEAAIKGAYYSLELSRARAEGRIGAVPYDPAMKVHTAWDLGKGQNMAVGFYQRFGRTVHMIDYLEGGGNDGLPQVIKKVLDKPYIYGLHFAPHDIKAVDLSTGKTRIETASSLGIDFTEVPDIGVDNGIHTGRLMFSRLWIDETKCAPFIDAIAQYRQEWDDKRGMFKLVPFHDWTSHGADQYRYAAVVEDLMSNESFGKTLSVFIPTDDD
jgi:hypothetical protein